MPQFTITNLHFASMKKNFKDFGVGEKKTIVPLMACNIAISMLFYVTFLSKPTILFDIFSYYIFFYGRGQSYYETRTS